MTMIKSPMAGSIWKWEVAVGDVVKVGQDVVILESMKMEIPVQAEVAGTVKQILVAEGDFIDVDQDLIELE